MQLTNEFQERLAAYVAIVQEVTDEYFAREFSKLTPPRFSIDPKGQKFVRVVQEDNADGVASSVHSFVEVSSGNVLFPAGWKGPQKKTPRGNIWGADGGREALSDNGRVRYLR